MREVSNSSEITALRIDQRLVKRLSACGINLVGELTARSYEEIRTVTRFRRSSMGKIEEALSCNGLGFAMGDESTYPTDVAPVSEIDALGLDGETAGMLKARRLTSFRDLTAMSVTDLSRSVPELGETRLRKIEIALGLFGMQLTPAPLPADCCARLGLRIDGMPLPGSYSIPRDIRTGLPLQSGKGIRPGVPVRLRHRSVTVSGVVESVDHWYVDSKVLLVTLFDMTLTVFASSDWVMEALTT